MWQFWPGETMSHYQIYVVPLLSTLSAEAQCGKWATRRHQTRPKFCVPLLIEFQNTRRLNLIAFQPSRKSLSPTQLYWHHHLVKTLKGTLTLFVEDGKDPRSTAGLQGNPSVHIDDFFRRLLCGVLWLWKILISNLRRRIYLRDKSNVKNSWCKLPHHIIEC